MTFGKVISSQSGIRYSYITHTGLGVVTRDDDNDGGEGAALFLCEHFIHAIPLTDSPIYSITNINIGCHKWCATNGSVGPRLFSL